jgi:hypothetical protein
MIPNYSYLLLGRILKPDKITGVAGRILADSVLSVNKRIKKRNLLHFKIAYGSEISSLFNTAADALCAMVYLEEELTQKGLGPVMHWSIYKGTFPIIKDENRNLIIGGKELPILRQSLLKEKSKSRFFIKTGDRSDDFYLLQGLILWNLIIYNWNIKRDKEILAIYLDGYDYKFAADALNVARPQTWRKYRSLQMQAYFSIREILLSGRLLSENNSSGDISFRITKP